MDEHGPFTVDFPIYFWRLNSILGLHVLLLSLGGQNLKGWVWKNHDQPICTSQGLKNLTQTRIIWQLIGDWWLRLKHSCHLVQRIFTLWPRVFPTHDRWTLFERLVLSSPCRNLGQGYLVTVHAVEAFPSLSPAAPCGVILTPRKLELWEFAFHLSMWAKPVPSGKNRLWLAT